jgi:hypothetical protein
MRQACESDRSVTRFVQDHSVTFNFDKNRLGVNVFVQNEEFDIHTKNIIMHNYNFVYINIFRQQDKRF